MHKWNEPFASQYLLYLPLAYHLHMLAYPVSPSTTVFSACMYSFLFTEELLGRTHEWGGRIHLPFKHPQRNAGPVRLGQLNLSCKHRGPMTMFQPNLVSSPDGQDAKH